MKHFKRTNTYKASNMSFNVNTCEALSYHWWFFVKKIKGKVVFNEFNYSPTTSRHQSKVRSLLSKLGIKVNLYIESPDGLQSLSSATSHYNQRIEANKAKMTNPRVRMHTKEHLVQSIDRDIRALELVKELCTDDQTLDSNDSIKSVG